MPKPLSANEVLERARTALMHAQAIDLTAIPRCPTRGAAIAKKRKFLLKAEGYAHRFSGKLKLPPGCTKDAQREGMAVYQICQEEWPDPNTLPKFASPYEGEVLDIQIVLRLIGPSFAPQLKPGQMHCWISDKAGGIVTSQIRASLAEIDPALAQVWQDNQIEGYSYNEIAKARGLTREQVRQRWAKAGRLLRAGLVKSYVKEMLKYTVSVTYVRYGELDPDWFSVKETVKETGYSASHLRHLISKKLLEAVKSGGKWMISRESMSQYLTSAGSD